MPVLIGLFVLYVIATAYLMRRSLATKDPAQRYIEAKRLLIVSALGVPLLVGFIFAI